MYNPLSLGHWRPVLHRQAPGVTDVALTFDDGPSPDTTPKVLDILARHGAKATFFLTGVRVAAHPGLAADIIAAGHAVFGHGWEHEDLEKAGAERALCAMRRVEDLLARMRPTPDPYLLRLPYNAGYNRSWMHRAMARFHPDVRFAWWSHATNDHLLAEGCDSRAELRARCLAVAARLGQDRDLPGGIVLMHENPFGARGRLAPLVVETLLPPVLEAIAGRGLRAGLVQPAPHSSRRDRFLFLNLGRNREAWMREPEGRRPAGTCAPTGFGA